MNARLVIFSLILFFMAFVDSVKDFNKWLNNNSGRGLR